MERIDWRENPRHKNNWLIVSNWWRSTWSNLSQLRLRRSDLGRRGVNPGILSDHLLGDIGLLEHMGERVRPILEARAPTMRNTGV